MISIKERLDLINKGFGKCVIANDGVNVSIRCPNKDCSSHDASRKLKLTIRIDNEAYHCWVCSLKGRGVIRLFERYAPNLLPEAREVFKASKYQPSSSEEIEAFEEDLEIPENFQLLARLNRSRNSYHVAARDYLFARGLSEQDLWRYRVGISTKKNLRGRVVIPSIDAEGKLNYWVARDFTGKKSLKYVNPKVSKTKIIFNEADLDFRKEMTLVEGAFDMFKCDDNATCLLGSSLSKKSLLFEELARHATPVVLALDSDMVIKSQKICKELYQAGCEVKILPLGEKSDVGEMTKQEFLQKKKEAKPWNPDDFLFKAIDSIEGNKFL